MLSNPGDESTPHTETRAVELSEAEAAQLESRRARRQRRVTSEPESTRAAAADAEHSTESNFSSRRARRQALQSAPEAAVATTANTAESDVDVAVDVQQYPSRRSRRHSAVPQPDIEIVAIETDLHIATDEAPAQTAVPQTDIDDLQPATVLDDTEAEVPAIDLHLDALSDEDFLRPAAISDAPEPAAPAASVAHDDTSGARSFEAIIAGSYGSSLGTGDSDENDEMPTPAGVQSSARARHRASADAPVEAPKAPRSIRRLAAKTMSISALLAVGLMTVATSVPANALLSADDVQAQKRVAQAQGDFGTDAASQTMVNTASSDVSLTRDTYGALSATEAAAQLGIIPEATFTNDPNGTVQWPFAIGVHIGSGYGPRAGCSLGCSTNHLGQDFNPGYGAPVQSIADGVVIESTDAGGAFGVKIVIEHTIDGQMIHTVYGHMVPGSRMVQVGDHVSVGQNIGKTGSTGVSTGPHLHFEVLINGTEHVDPLAWLYANTN